MAEMDDDFSDTRDFPWFAVDEAGQLASLRTAGFGHVPTSVRSSKETNKMLGEFVDTLPTLGSTVLDAAFLERIPEQTFQPIDADLKLSRQGLYVYDAHPNYDIPRSLDHRVCSPTRPLTLAELPPEIQTALGRTKLNGQTFASLPVVDVSLIP